MAEVVLEHVTKVYPNGVQAVRDLSLKVAEGELVVLIGPSGCGKTTTLRLLAGLEQPSSGTISIGGRPMNALPPRDRDVAMVFQRSVLYPHLNVRRNLSFGLEMRNRSGWQSKLALRWLRPAAYARVQRQNQTLTEQVANAARLIRLDSIMDRLPGQLSGGEQQRVALGRALVRRPGVFLLDEPLSQLDGRLRAELRHELHLLQRQLRATMIYVTHDQAEAMTLADRVAVLDQGVVQQVDRPMAVYERPCNRFVAGFLGWPAMNFMEGQLLRTPAALHFVAPGWPPLAVPPGRTNSWMPQAGKPVVLGIRPEDIELATPVLNAVTLAMEVALVEPLGHAWLVTLRRNGQHWVARLTDRQGINTEQTVEVRINMGHAHLFDRVTGSALSQGRLTG